MSRPFAINPVLPNITEPIAQLNGEPIYLTDAYRRYFEDDHMSVNYNGADLVKDVQDSVSGLQTDYYTRSESDSRFAAISTTYTITQVNSLLSSKADNGHTHNSTDISGDFDISRITGLQSALDGKVGEVTLTDLATDGSSTVAQIEAAINAINNALSGS